MDNDKLIISPSILSADFASIRDEITAAAEAGADCIHFDVMDNHFVPNLTFGYKFVADAIRICPITTDVHLMIEKPHEAVAEFLKEKPDYLSFHVEACSEQEIDSALTMLEQNGVKTRLAIKPATPLSELEPWIERLDSVLVMLVEPGFGGQQMLQETVDKIAAVKQMAAAKGTDIVIQIDGGIKQDNFLPLVELGARDLVVGSGFYAQPDYQAVVGRFRRDFAAWLAQ